MTNQMRQVTLDDATGTATVTARFTGFMPEPEWPIQKRAGIVLIVLLDPLRRTLFAVDRCGVSTTSEIAMSVLTLVLY